MSILQPAFAFPPPLPPEMLKRIDDARMSGNLSECAAAVLNILADADEPHAGSDSAIQIREMQALWAGTGRKVWSDRIVKASAKELLEAHHVPVGSSRVVGRAGYYLISNSSDVVEAERALKGEVRSIARRLKAINPQSSFVRHLLGQLELEG